MGLLGSMTTSPTDINTQATLTVSVTLFDSLTSGDQIQLTDVSPGSFSTSDTTCGITSEFSGWLTISNCDVSETSVIVTLEPIYDVLLFQIEFTQFTNPPSSSETEMTIQRYKSGTLYEDGVATLSGLTPIRLTGATLTALDDQIGASNVEIQFTVTLANDLPINGQVHLTVPYWNPDASSS